MFEMNNGKTLTDDLIGKMKGMIADLPLQGRYKDILTDLFFGIARSANLYKIDKSELVAIGKAVQELLGAFGMFSMYKNIPKVTIFGSARIKPENSEYKLAYDFAAMIKSFGYYVITGAGPGIMEAGNAGAGREHSFGLNIMLPFEKSSNSVIHGDIKDFTFRYFFTRKLMFIKESSAIVVCPGGYGTMDELYEALTLMQNGKTNVVPIVLLNTPGSDFWHKWDDFVINQYIKHKLVSEHDRYLYTIKNTPEEACEVITKFYRNFHSYRYWKDNMLIMRVKKHLSDNQLAHLSNQFKFICNDGKIHHISEQPFFDKNVPGMESIYYLGIHFNQKDYGTLRQVIDAINEF